MSEVNTIAVLSPAPDKVERLKEVLAGLAAEVHSKEDDTLRYLMTEQLDSETPDIIMVETYASKEASAKHSQTPHFQTVFATLQQEGLLAKAPYIVNTVNKAGFDFDRKLISSKI